MEIAERIIFKNANHCTSNEYIKTTDTVDISTIFWILKITTFDHVERKIIKVDCPYIICDKIDV